jgi:hypothetical protein
MIGLITFGIGSAYLVRHDVEEKIGGGIQVTGRGGRRCKQTLDDLKAVFLRQVSVER